jgi:hypothetical protein
MKFIITRTSVWYNENPRCEGATKETVTKTSIGSWKTLADAKKDNGKGWFFKEGTFNHREIEGQVAHDYHSECWVLEVNTVEQLIDLVKEYGNLILKYRDSIPEIEIYDDYRE